MLFTLNKSDKYYKLKFLLGILILTCLFLANIAHSQQDKTERRDISGLFPGWVCQRGSIGADQGCIGKIGLMRLNRSTYANTPFDRKRGSSILFGTEELPAVGSIVTLKRSAHLRDYYFALRDDQDVRSTDKICNRVGCINTLSLEYCNEKDVNKKLNWINGETLKKARLLKNIRGDIPCVGPTELTDYFAAGTQVKILGYQQMGAFFALVQIIKMESDDPEEDEKKYVFDRKEVI